MKSIINHLLPFTGIVTLVIGLFLLRPLCKFILKGNRHRGTGPISKVLNLIDLDSSKSNHRFHWIPFFASFILCLTSSFIIIKTTSQSQISLSLSSEAIPDKILSVNSNSEIWDLVEYGNRMSVGNDSVTSLYLINNKESIFSNFVKFSERSFDLEQDYKIGSIYSSSPLLSNTYRNKTTLKKLPNSDYNEYEFVGLTNDSILVHNLHNLNGLLDFISVLNNDFKELHEAYELNIFIKGFADDTRTAWELPMLEKDSVYHKIEYIPYLDTQIGNTIRFDYQMSQLDTQTIDGYYRNVHLPILRAKRIQKEILDPSLERIFSQELRESISTQILQGDIVNNMMGYTDMRFVQLFLQISKKT